MNCLVSLICIILSGLISSNAQSLFTLDSLISSDKVLTYHTASVEGSLNSVGADQQWNFSWLDGEPGMIYRLAGQNLFPMLNAPQGASKLLIKVFESGASPEDPINFFKADASGLERLTLRAAGQQYAAYSAPYKELHFPVAYNPNQIISSTSVTFTDAIEMGSSDSIRIHREIDLYYSVPGYGQITLPDNKTYQGLVVERLETVRDSAELYENGVWTSFPTETYFNEFYDFLTPSLGYYVMMAKLVEGDESSMYELRYLHEDEIVGLPVLTEQNVVVYPNPAQGQIFIQGISIPSEIQLLDMQGRIVQQWQQAHDGALALNSHPAGFYLHRVVNLQENSTHKIIIQ